MIYVKRRKLRRLWIRRKLSSNYYASIEDDEEHLVDTAENVAIADECVIRGSSISNGGTVEWHSSKRDDDLLSGDALGFGSDDDDFPQISRKPKAKEEKSKQTKQKPGKSPTSKKTRYREDSDDDILV